MPVQTNSSLTLASIWPYDWICVSFSLFSVVWWWPEDTWGCCVGHRYAPAFSCSLCVWLCRYWRRTLGLQVRYADCGGYRFCYSCRGRPGMRPSILLLHGFSAHKDTWLTVIKVSGFAAINISIMHDHLDAITNMKNIDDNVHVFQATATIHFNNNNS